jgi:hypothetical protein
MACRRIVKLRRGLLLWPLVGPFLKEFVKLKRFPFGLVRNGSAWRCRLVLWVQWSRCIAGSYRFHFFGIRLGCRRCGKLQSFFSDAIAPNTFLREVPLTLAVSSSAVQRQTRIYLVRIPHRKGHSIQRDVLPGFDPCGRKPPHPRSDSSWPKREGSQVATGQLRSNNRAESWFVMSPLCFVPVRHRLPDDSNTFGLGGG